VGATVLGGLCALEWAWHPAETNLRCSRSSGICKPNPNILALIVSETAALIRRTWLDRLGSTQTFFWVHRVLMRTIHFS